MTDTEALIRAAYNRHLDEALTAVRMPTLPTRPRRRRAPLVAAGAAAAAVAFVAVGVATLRHHTGVGPSTGTPASAAGVSRSTPPGQPPDALQLQAAAACKAALGADVASAAATTVGTVRGWTIGPVAASPTTPANQYADAFPGAADDDFAAWCWVGQNSHWHSWAVDSHGTKVDMQTDVGAATAPTGGPQLP